MFAGTAAPDEGPLRAEGERKCDQELRDDGADGGVREADPALQFHPPDNRDHDDEDHPEDHLGRRPQRRIDEEEECRQIGRADHDLAEAGRIIEANEFGMDDPVVVAPAPHVVEREDDDEGEDEAAGYKRAEDATEHVLNLSRLGRWLGCRKW